MKQKKGEEDPQAEGHDETHVEEKEEEEDEEDEEDDEEEEEEEDEEEEEPQPRVEAQAPPIEQRDKIPFTIGVQEFGGNLWHLRCISSTTILRVLNALEGLEGIPAVKLRLHLDGQRLFDVSRSLGEYNIGDGDVLDLSREQRGC
jgi:hypothetical protein